MRRITSCWTCPHARNMILGSTYRRPHLLSSPRITIVNDRYDVSSIHRQITLGGTPGDWVSKQRINWPGWESGVHFCGPLRWIYNVWPTLLYLSLIVTRQSRGVYPMLVQCWYDVYDVGPPLNQHWMNASCLPGCTQVCQTVLDPLRLSRVDYGCSNRVSACNPPPPRHRCCNANHKPRRRFTTGPTYADVGPAVNLNQPFVFTVWPYDGVAHNSAYLFCGVIISSRLSRGGYSAVRNQNAVSAYFTSIYSVFALQSGISI